MCGAHRTTQNSCSRMHRILWAAVRNGRISDILETQEKETAKAVEARLLAAE